MFTDGGSVQAQLNSRQDPRAQMQWMRENLPLLRQRLPQIASDGGNLTSAVEEIGPESDLKPVPPVQSPPPGLRGDWNFSLQTAATNSGVADQVSGKIYLRSGRSGQLRHGFCCLRAEREGHRDPGEPDRNQ